ncbi:MAG: InlB B-repeat-containing protein [Oscillospiraceae bacterium]|nr:InlB B-repeat-containing protein [Oscillospiraceae bacterium]
MKRHRMLTKLLIVCIAIAMLIPFAKAIHTTVNTYHIATYNFQLDVNAPEGAQVEIEKDTGSIKLWKTITTKYNGSTTTSYSYENLSIPTPSCDGYHFGGWYNDAACSQPFEPSYKTSPVTNDTIVYAKWGKLGEATVVSAPTCTVEGETAAVCERCGETVSAAIPVVECAFETYVSDENGTCTKNSTQTAQCIYGCGNTDTIELPDSELGHIYDADGICDRCGERVQLVAIAGANMTLGNALHMNFLLSIDQIDTTDDYTAKITHNGQVTELLFTPVNSDYYAVTYPLTAKQMNDELILEVFDEKGNAVSAVYTDSVCSYAARALDNSNDSEVRRFVVDMLNYGAAAQKFFKYNTRNLANSILTEEEQALASEKVECINRQIKGAHCYGSNLTLESNIQMNMYFKDISADDVADMYAIVSFTDHTGTAQSVRIEGEDFVHYFGDIYKIQNSALVLSDARKTVTCVVFNADGSIFDHATDSVESYVKRAEGSTSSYLCEAIMKFAVSAHELLH